jgi:hypothetical protein
MGLFDRKRTIETVAVTRGADVAAQIGPAPTLDAFSHLVELITLQAVRKQ